MGNLADLGLGDIFQIVSLSRRSGTLQLTTPVESGEIVFRVGKVVAAYRSNAGSSIAEGLMDAGVITPTVYQEMLAVQRSGKHAPDLFDAFSVNRDALREALDNILKQVIYAMFEWNEGTFSFVLEDTPDVWRGFTIEGARAVAIDGLNPQYLAIEGARLRDERVQEDSLSSFLLKEQPSSAARPAAGLNVQEIAAKLRSAAELDARPADSAASQATAVGGGSTPPASVSVSAVVATASPPVSDVRAPMSPAIAVAELHRAAASDASPSVLEAEPPVVESEPASPLPVLAASVAADLEPRKAAARYRLLAVDDDLQMVKYIEGALKKSFATIVAVDNVAAALAEIDANPHDLVVASDLIIARSDGRGILGGIEILERAHQRLSQMPVVLFSDYQNEEAEARARSMGVLSILQKPRKAQVQAAAKDGTGRVVHEFIAGLTRVLTPYFGPGVLDQPPVGSAIVVGPAPVVPAPARIVAPFVEAPTLADVVATSIQRPSPVVLSPDSPPTSAAKVVGDGASTSFDLGSEMSHELDDLGGSLDAELPPALISGGEMAVLRSMVAELIDPANRDTVTLLVLRFASHLVERAGLFLATRRSYVGLGGFSVDEPSDQFVGRVRRIQIPVDVDSVFARVCHFRSMIRAPLKETEGNRRLVSGFGGIWPAGDTVAAPLISGDRVAAILFGDNPSGKPLGVTDSLEIFLQQAGLAMDRALLERKLEDTRKQRGGPE